MPTKKRSDSDRRRVTRRTFVSLAGAVPAWPARKRLRVAERKGEKVSVIYGEQPLLEYRYDRSRPKPYVHPLYLPNGVPVTLDSPPDHVHHRGLMLAWSNVSGFDFWGEVNLGPHGQIVHQRFERLREGEAAILAALNHWVAEGRVLLVERRRLDVPAPKAEGVWLEWESVLRAQREAVTLSAEGHVYDGLGIRFPHPMDGGLVLNARGSTQIEAANGEPAPWCTYYGAREGVAVFDHPENPRHPTPFFVMNKPFGYLSAAPTFREPLRLSPGGSLRLRWAVMSYLGQPDRATLDRVYRGWVSTRGQRESWP